MSKPKLSEIEGRAQRALHNYDYFTNDADRSLGIDVPTLTAAIRAVLEMLGGPRDAVYTGTGSYFEGFRGGPEHRTVGSHRAWCYEASEWCYPMMPCASCGGTVEVADVRAALAAHLDLS